MVAFRKLFPVLAIGAFLLGTATNASAQATGGNPLVCDTNAGVPPVVRAEGYTELVGDIVIVARVVTRRRRLTANFQLFLNTNVTSRCRPTVYRSIADDRRARQSGRTALALRLVRLDSGCLSTERSRLLGRLYPASAPACNPATANMQYQTGHLQCVSRRSRPTARTAPHNALVWTGIPIVPPGTEPTPARSASRTSRATPPALVFRASLVPTRSSRSFLASRPASPLALNNPQQAVAFVQPGLQFDVRNCQRRRRRDELIPRNFVSASEPR